MEAQSIESQPLLPHGTVRVFAEDGSQALILHPQPTASRDDPLNWSLTRKFLSASIVLFVTAFTAATSNSAGSASNELVNHYGITWNQVNAAAGVLFIGIGYGTLLLSSAPWLYGRRISYLVCLLFSIVGNIWFARATTASNNIGSQLFVGVSEAVAEATVQLSLSDLFFQHQRGMVLGLYVLATSVGTFLGPLISGYIADSDLGWPWIGYFAAIVTGCTLVVTYFGLEETAFDRSGPAPTTTEVECLQEPFTEFQGISSAGLKQEKAWSPSGDHQLLATSPKNKEADCSSDDNVQHAPKTYWQRIAVITPSPSLVGSGFKQYFVRMLNNVKIMWFPAVVYAGMQWGFQDAWLTFYLTAEEDNWTSAPYNYGDVADSLMNVPTLIGACIGCVYGGALSDSFVRLIAKRKGGIYEAEDRLWLMLLPAIICPVGLIIFGIATNNVWPWQIAYVALGFIGFGWGCAGDLSMAYTMDAYPDMVLEGMVGVSVINNTLACIFSFVCSQWMAVHSVAEVFVVIGIVAFIIMFPMTLFMILYGKRLRMWTTPRYEQFLATRG